MVAILLLGRFLASSPDARGVGAWRLRRFPPQGRSSRLGAAVAWKSAKAGDHGRKYGQAPGLVKWIGLLGFSAIQVTTATTTPITTRPTDDRADTRERPNTR